MAPLTLESAIGFNGAVVSGLQVHPNREHLIYPLGATLVIEKIAGKKTQGFLSGHNSAITVVAVSSDGRYIASGATASPNEKAHIIVWDFEKRMEVHRFSLHNNVVRGLSFSPTGKYLASIGDEADGLLALWNVSTGKPVSSARTANGRSGVASCVAFSKVDDHSIITGGANHMRIWRVQSKTKQLVPSDCVVRGLIRVCTCVSVSEDGSLCYFGTSSGDVVEINIASGGLRTVGPERAKFELGVTSVKSLANGNVLIGAGDGTVALVSPAKWRIIHSAKLQGAVTSISIRGDGHEIYVGTDHSSIFRVGYADFGIQQRFTGHSAPVRDIAFPRLTNALFITCASNEIRVWHIPSNKVLLKITVDCGAKCNCIAISPEGNLILSGWSDGSIRAFLPESGKQFFETQCVGGSGITAIAFCSDPTKFVTGDGIGQIQVWRIEYASAVLHTSLKDHRDAITSIHVSDTDEECVSSSEDGSCIIWNLVNECRSQVVTGTTKFRQARYSADEAQVLTVGTDRKAAYWEVYDGSLIREKEVSPKGSLNAVDISANGEEFVVGGSDKLVQLFSYKSCERIAVGSEHGAAVTRAKICPNRTHIVSVSEDGAILRWKFPTA